MSGRPLLLVTLPVLTVLAICLYLRRRGRQDGDPPEPAPPDQPAAQKATATSKTAEQPAAQSVAKPVAKPAAKPAAQTAAKPAEQLTAAEPKQPAAAEPKQTAGRDLGQVTAWVRDNIETRQPVAEEPAAVRSEAAAVTAAARHQPAQQKANAPAPAAGGDALRELEAAVLPAPTAEQGGGDAGTGQAPAAAEEAPVTAAKAPVTSAEAPLSAEEPLVAETQPSEAAAEEAVAAAGPAEPASGAEVAEPPAENGTAETGADTASENSSDSGKGGSSTSLEQASPSTSPDSGPLKTTVYDFLIPQKLCGRLIGKSGTFVNMLKARTGAHVIIRLHPVKSNAKICSVDGTQSEVDACLKMIREKFPVNKFPAMTLEQLNRPTEQGLAVPDSQQLHLSQGVTCDVLVSAVVSAGQLFLQQHAHPTFRGLERLTTLMAACYADGSATPELPRPVLASSICAAPVAGGWYRAQVVAFYPDTDELDVRFMDFGGYSRIPAAHARQIRTDFMSLPFQAEECYLANVMPVSEDGWSLEAGAVFESLITERALEAMVVGYAEDGTPFVNLYSIQGTEYGNNVISLVNQQLMESGAARWVEHQA